MEKILIIDDEIENLEILKTRLIKSEFEVITSNSPREGIKLAQKHNPDLILLDLNMPDMDGYQVCKVLKDNYSTSNIPVILLTCMDSLDHKLTGLEGGADDYLVKDKIDYREMAARIRSHLRRSKATMSANPLTQLPGNRSIEAEILKRLESPHSFAVGYLDIDNFKAFNDYYSFQQGDRVIKFIADSLVRAVSQLGAEEDFVGHIGGDDFIFITQPQNARPIAEAVVKWVDKVSPQLYHKEDQDRGYIDGKDRDGNPKRFGFIGVTIALVFSTKDYESYEDFSETAGVIKKMLKNSGGSRFAGPEVLK